MLELHLEVVSVSTSAHIIRHEQHAVHSVDALRPAQFTVSAVTTTAMHHTSALSSVVSAMSVNDTTQKQV
jgi:hypothetical protein